MIELFWGSFHFGLLFLNFLEKILQAIKPPLSLFVLDKVADGKENKV